MTIKVILILGEILEYLIVKMNEVPVSVDGAKEIHNRHRRIKKRKWKLEFNCKNLLEEVKKLDSLKIRMTYIPE